MILGGSVVARRAGAAPSAVTEVTADIRPRARPRTRSAGPVGSRVDDIRSDPRAPTISFVVLEMDEKREQETEAEQESEHQITDSYLLRDQQLVRG